MDNICAWFEKILEWVDRSGPPTIPFAGCSEGGYANPPAPYLEVVCLLKGSVNNLRIGDRQANFSADSIVLHNVHQGCFTPDMIRMKSWCVFLDVSGEPQFAGLADSPLFCRTPLVHRQQVVEAFERLAKRCMAFRTGQSRYPFGRPMFDVSTGRGRSSTAAVYVKAALLDLLAVLLDEARGSSGQASMLKPVAVQAAVDFIAINYRRPGLSLGEIARAAHLNADHFGRCFHEHMGISPMHYLRNVRIAQARRLLEQTAMRVKEVAGETGFDDAFHFSRVFKTLVGKSPQDYRR